MISQLMFSRVVLPAAMLAIGLTAAVAQAERPLLRLPRVDTPPKLSDYLNGNRRPEELRISDFREREPNDGAPTILKTTAYLSYDAKNIYAIFVCQENQSLIRAHMSRREDIMDDDRVSISIDTFHDGRRAYEFFSNPLGIQRDGLITEGQDDDFNFDTVWSSEGRLTPDGFVVRFAVPFKSLRFASAPGATWGIALGRYSPATKEFSTWPYITEKVEAYVSQFEPLPAVGQESAGHNVQLIPYAFFAGQRFLDTINPSAPAFQTQNEWRGGLDGKFVLHDALTFDFTANPDFSQVESDEPQVTANQRYEAFFPERRPFFTEGSGFFATPETLFFSRRVIDPQFGLRMTGKIGQWALGVLGADDRAPGRLLDRSNPFYGQRAKIGVVRAVRDVGKNSMVGGFFSRRHFANTSNQVVSLDTRLKLNPNWFFTGQAARSESRDDSSGRLSGSDYFAELRHTGLHLDYSTSYLDRSPGFQADLGFIPRVDLRQLKSVLGYNWRPEHGSLVSFGPSLQARTLWDHRGQMQEWEIDAPFSFQFKGPSSLSVGRIEEFETFQGIGFRENASYVYFSTQRLRWVGFDSSYVHGTNINFVPAEGVLPFLANSDDVTLGVTFRPTSCLQLQQSYLYSRLGARTRVMEKPSGSSVFNNHLLRTKISYQLTKSLSLRGIVDYDAVLPNAILTNLDRSKQVAADILFAYLVNPGTAIYAGYSNRRENLDFSPGDPILRRTASPSLTTGKQFFVKVSYLFRF